MCINFITPLNNSYIQSLGVKKEFFIWVCYEASSPNFFWRIFIFTYLAILQIVGMLLAFQTRKVKIKGLNDSKFVATIIYISSIVLVALALVTFALRVYINIGTGVFVAGILTLTTIFLALSFIPKVGSEQQYMSCTHAAAIITAFLLLMLYYYK